MNCLKDIKNCLGKNEYNPVKTIKLWYTLIHSFIAAETA